MDVVVVALREPCVAGVPVVTPCLSLVVVVEVRLEATALPVPAANPLSSERVSLIVVEFRPEIYAGSDFTPELRASFRPDDPELPTDPR